MEKMSISTDNEIKVMTEGKNPRPRTKKSRKVEKKCSINEIGSKVLKKRKKNGNRSGTVVKEGGKNSVSLSSDVKCSGSRNKDNLTKTLTLIMKGAKRRKKTRLRKRSQKSSKGKHNCSVDLLPGENQSSHYSVSTLEKVSTGIGIRNPSKKKKNRRKPQTFANKGEKQCVSSGQNVEGSAKRIKDNLSKSSSLKTKEAGQCSKVRVRGKKRRKSKNKNNKNSQMVEKSKKPCINHEAFKHTPKRKFNDSQEDNLETKRRRIESNNSCLGSGRQRGNNSLQYISPAKKQAINLTSNDDSVKVLSGNRLKKKIILDDNKELSSSKKHGKSRKQPHDVSHNKCSEGLEGIGDTHFSKNFNYNISKNKTVSSPSNGHSFLSGNRLNKIIKFNDDENIELPPSKKLNSIDFNEQKRNMKRSKHSDKMQPECGKKKNKLIKSEKEITSGINGKSKEKRVDDGNGTTTLEETKTKATNDACLSLRQRMLSQLKSSQFRFLNQQLYTSNSSEANILFQKDPVLFENYHEGFKRQVEQWPINPIDRIIKGILRRPADLVVADFGCGDAKLAKSVPNKVHSFDLVALSDEVTVCDMANTPLKDASVDVCVFCLSLMGTNLESFIIEANRVLKMSGVLKIAEVASRFEKVESFINDLKKYGFAFANKDFSHNLFYFINFTKSSNITKPKGLPPLNLKPCMYKKR